MKKTLTIIVCVILVAAIGVGGTLAWLTATSDTLTNTFTLGNVKITLAETTGSTYKMSPGSTIAKDPKVTVIKDSEDCYLFVKIEGVDGIDDYITYDVVGAGWTALAGETGVYYRTVADVTANITFDVLNGNKVTVKDTVTGIPDGKAPQLVITAYAIQSANMDDVADAWAKLTTPPTP